MTPAKRLRAALDRIKAVDPAGAGEWAAGATAMYRCARKIILREARRVERLTEQLRRCANLLEESSCTCANRSGPTVTATGHKRNCSGVRMAGDFHRSVAMRYANIGGGGG